MARDIATACTAQAQAGELGHEAANGYALAIARVARAIRQNHALEARLVKDCEAAGVERAKRLKREAQDRLEDHMEQVRDRMERAIDAHASGRDAEALSEDANEWLLDAADAPEFVDRPVAEIVGEICRNLRIPVPEVWLQADAATDDDAPADAADAEPDPPDGPHIIRWGVPTPAGRGTPRSAEATPPHNHRLE